MANVKISQLTEMRADQLDLTDYFIVNDTDIGVVNRPAFTRSLSFASLIGGLSKQEITFDNVITINQNIEGDWIDQLELLLGISVEIGEVPTYPGFPYDIIEGNGLISIWGALNNLDNQVSINKTDIADLYNQIARIDGELTSIKNDIAQLQAEDHIKSDFVTHYDPLN